MENGIYNKQFILSRIFTSGIVFPVLFTLLTALFSSCVSAQEQQETQTPIYYLMQDQTIQHTWNDSPDYWSEDATPSTVYNSIFVVGNDFHLRPQRIVNATFGYYHGAGSNTNKLYIGYYVDLSTGTVDLNNYVGDDIYGVLHLKTGAKRSAENESDREGNITVDDMYIGHGEIFQGESNSTIHLYGSLTVQGDLTFRNVAEDAANVEDRVLYIHNDIYGDGIIQFEGQKSEGKHSAEIYLASSENKFSGKVFVESGTHITADTGKEYDYQTHLFITGKNALFKATHILNEGIIVVSADQIFNNYDGDDSFGQFSGVGQLIVNEGVTVELHYDNPDLGYEPFGLITVNNNNEGTNPGTLKFNISDGMTKSIFMTEDPAEYSKIEGQGNLVKTGDGTLQIVAASEGLVGAESFVISSGRIDYQGCFQSGMQLPCDVVVEDGGELSPGIGVGDMTVNYGNVTIENGGAALFDFGAYRNDPSQQMYDTLLINHGVIISDSDDYSFTVEQGGIIDLHFLNNDALKWAKEGAVYQLVFDQDFADGNYDDLLPDQYKSMFSLEGRNGDGLYLIGLGAPEPEPVVPEPSTWALLILGVVVLFLRKRVRN